MSVFTEILRAPVIFVLPMMETIVTETPALLNKSTAVSPSTSSKPSAQNTYTERIISLLYFVNKFIILNNILLAPFYQAWSYFFHFISPKNMILYSNTLLSTVIF